MKCINDILRLNINIFVLAAVLIVVPSGIATAVVSGDCVNCHTMHNSQGGDTMAEVLNSGKTAFEPDTSPNQFLLQSDCVGCHASTGSSTIVNNVPIIFNTGSYPGSPLAGGNFRSVIDDDLKGHNVTGIKAQDGTLGLTPPGGSIMASQLTCAGEYGCHGDRSESDDYTGIRGAHHTDDSTIDGSTVGESYRFLNGILGTEDDDWQQDNSNSSHNEYKGATSPGGSNTDTISYLCSLCHGNFHSDSGVGSASPWLRHPTDRALPTTGEYASYQTYSTLAPVARPDLGSISAADAVDDGDIVMCLSCHRAHSSPYNKMLRWNIKGSLSEAMSGCNVCHTSKD